MKAKLLFSAGCSACAAVCWKSALQFDGTEFGGGTLAGNQGISTLLFLLAAVFSFRLARAAYASALISCYFSLPLYLYLVFPRPFRQVWPGEWSNPVLPLEKFVWNGWWITGIVVTTLVGAVCVSQLIRGLRTRLSARFDRQEGTAP